MEFIVIYTIYPSLKLTANAPENRPGLPQKGKESVFQSHPFLGAKNMLVSGRVENLVDLFEMRYEWMNDSSCGN